MFKIEESFFIDKGDVRMFSVTQFIRRVGMSLPQTYTVKVQRFVKDDIQLDTDSESMWLFGLATDYLARLVFGDNPQKAFEISLKGAKNVGELNKATELLKSVNTSLDNKCIINACKLCAYDVAYRTSPALYSNVDNINPSEKTISKIRVLVKRTVKFLKQNSKWVDYDIDFPRGYSELISKGDCDYITDEALWDLKVTNDKTAKKRYVSQILLYYVLGMRSKYHDRFENLKRIGLIYPIDQVAYYIETKDISDKDFALIAHDGLGLKADEKNWKKTNEMDEKMLNDITKGMSFTFTDFDPDKYKDGIFDISIDDFCTYYLDKALKTSITWKKPKFNYTKKIKFLKKNNFLMFISIDSKGQLSVLRGGKRELLEHDLEFYYKNIDIYANQILKLFGRYWDALYQISEALQNIQVNIDDSIYLPLEYNVRRKLSEGLSGEVHGSIIDLDFTNHLYINPFDGSVHGYTARDIKDRDVYKRLPELIFYQFPGFYRDFRKKLIVGKMPLLIDNEKSLISKDKQFLIGKAKKIPTLQNMIKEVGKKEPQTTHISETETYRISRKLLALQSIYDYNLITCWDDRFLDKNNSNEVVKISEKYSPGNNKKQISYKKEENR